MKTFKKVFQQTGWQIIGKGISAFSTIYILAIITRLYGEYGTGIYTLSLAYLSFFFLAADLGLNGYILPKLSKDVNQANILFSIRFIWSIILVIISNILVWFLPFKNELFVQSVFLGSVSIFFSGLFNSSNLVFQNNLRYDKSVISQSFGAAASLLVTFYLSSVKVPISILALGPLCGWIINGLSAMFFVRGFYKFKFFFPETKHIIALAKSAWPISLSLLLNVIYFRVDTFILSAWYSFSEVGIYNLAYQIFSNILVLPAFIMNGYYPLMIKTLTDYRVIFIKQIKFAGLFLLLASIVIAVLIWYLSPFIVQIVAGGGFEGSSRALRILSFGLPAYFLSALLMWTMVCVEKLKPMLSVYFLGLITNIFLNLLFIPAFSFIAASWVTVITEYLILILQITILWKEFSNYEPDN